MEEDNKNRLYSIIPSMGGRLSNLFEKHPYVVLYGTLYLALVLRVVAFQYLEKSLYFDYLLWDEKLYHEWAKKILNGTYQSTSVYEFAPLPAYFMALIYKIFEPYASYIRIFNIVLGVLTCYLIYHIGKDIANRTIGLFACLVAAVYEPFILYSIVPLKTALSVFLFALAVYLFIAIINRVSIMKVFFLGSTVGLMLNVRPNIVVIIPLLPLFILWSIYKSQPSLNKMLSALSMYLLGLAVVISPFVFRNYRVSGEIALTASQAGYNLYIANNLQNKDPYYRPAPFALSPPFLQGIHFNIEASRRVKKKLSPQEASSYWTGEVFRIACDHPPEFAWKMFQKTLALFNRFEAGDHYHIGFISEFVPFFKFPFLTLWLVLPLGMTGLIFSIRKAIRSIGVSFIFLLYSLTLIAFFPTSRFRLPLLVILIPFAVIGVERFLDYTRKRDMKKIASCLTVTMAFFVIEFLPIQGTDDMTAYYNTHAIILDSNGFEEEAIKYWKESSGMEKPYSSFANLSLATRYYTKGNKEKAFYYLNKIPDDSFAAASKYQLTGDIMLQQREIKKAISAYEKSLEINSGQIKPRLKLIKLLEKVDKERASRENEKLKYVSSFYRDL